VMTSSGCNLQALDASGQHSCPKGFTKYIPSCVQQACSVGGRGGCHHANPGGILPTSGCTAVQHSGRQQLSKKHARRRRCKGCTRCGERGRTEEQHHQTMPLSHESQILRKLPASFGLQQQQEETTRAVK
jgi:hypothetical protein